MEFKGRIIFKAKEIEVGANKTPKIAIVLEEVEDKQYKDKILIDFVGEEYVAMVRELEEGQVIRAFYNLRANKSNDDDQKWFGSNSGWMIKISKSVVDQPDSSVENDRNFGE